MAAKGSSSGNSYLIRNLQGNRYIRSPRVAHAMLEVDRGLFCSSYAYADSPQSIGHGATISAPHMHAIALEILCEKLVEGATVLDVGSGSGYLTACMSLLVGETGKVVGIEHIDQLVASSVQNIRRIPKLASRLDSGRLTIIAGDGRRGHRVMAPYDVIHVGAASNEIPQELIDQLRPGTGRLLIPVGEQTGSQKLVQVDKMSDGSLARRSHLSVNFIPLTSKKQQCWT